MDRDDVCDYVIVRLAESGECLSHLKLQKLMYYVQAWHLAFYNQPLFAGKFQAWIHGPVSRELYDRFVRTKSLYSPVRLDDIRPAFNPDTVPSDKASHINAVLEVYAPMADSQLENMTHEEDPWVQARAGYAPSQRCEAELNELTMMKYYAQRYEAQKQKQS
jgi:uncharacterized phage-associated protein